MDFPLKTLRDALRGKDFAVVGQLRLHQDHGRDDLIRQAECLSPAVDAVAVTDNPYGLVHMSGLAAASILLQQGIDPVPQLSARDRNRIALKSELLGAAALGVTSLVLQRGNKLPKDGQPQVKEVFDTGAKKFLAAAKQLSSFQVAQGLTELFLGTMVTVFDPDDGWQPTEIKAKVEAGAQFVQTQACLNVALLRRYMKFLVAAQVARRCHVLVSVPVLTSVESARWLAAHHRGAVIPDRLVGQFKRAKDPESFGIALCAETIQAIREIPGVGGVNLSTTGNPEAIVAAVNQAALD